MVRLNGNSFPIFLPLTKLDVEVRKEGKFRLLPNVDCQYRYTLSLLLQNFIRAQSIKASKAMVQAQHRKVYTIVWVKKNVSVQSFQQKIIQVFLFRK